MVSSCRHAATVGRSEYIRTWKARHGKACIRDWLRERSLYWSRADVCISQSSSVAHRAGRKKHARGATVQNRRQIMDEVAGGRRSWPGAGPRMKQRRGQVVRPEAGPRLHSHVNSLAPLPRLGPTLLSWPRLPANSISSNSPMLHRAPYLYNPLSVPAIAAGS